jgi:hypothetical protein
MNYQEAHEFRFVGFLRSGRSLVALEIALAKSIQPSEMTPEFGRF